MRRFFILLIPLALFLTGIYSSPQRIRSYSPLEILDLRTFTQNVRVFHTEKGRLPQFWDELRSLEYYNDYISQNITDQRPTERLKLIHPAVPFPSDTPNSEALVYAVSRNSEVTRAWETNWRGNREPTISEPGRYLLLWGSNHVVWLEESKFREYWDGLGLEYPKPHNLEGVPSIKKLRAETYGRFITRTFSVIVIIAYSIFLFFYLYRYKRQKIGK